MHASSLSSSLSPLVHLCVVFHVLLKNPPIACVRTSYFAIEAKNKLVQLSTTDLLALASMKDAAKCDK